MNRKVILYVLLPMAIIGIVVPLLYGSFAKEICIKINNKSNSSITIYRCFSYEADTLIFDIPPKKEACIGNWEGLSVEIKNNGLAEIKGKYDFLKVVMPDKSKKDLLKIIPDYKKTGYENHYTYLIE